MFWAHMQLPEYLYVKILTETGPNILLFALKFGKNLAKLLKKIFNKWVETNKPLEGVEKNKTWTLF